MAGIVITGTDTDGIVLSNPTTDDPATITATGSVTNNTATHNYDAIYGAPGYAWTVANLGAIQGVGPGAPTPPGAGDTGAHLDSSPGAGVHLTYGGVVTNGQQGSITGLIQGGATGVNIEGGTGNVTNFGKIESSDSDFAAGVYLQGGGSVTNGESGSTAGLIIGGTGVSIGSGVGTVINFGTIESSAGGYIVSGSGVSLFQGSVTNSVGGLISAIDMGVVISHGSGMVTNFGTISGGYVFGVSLGAGGSVGNFGKIEGGIGVAISGTLPGTLENAGTIIGNGGTAVQFGGGDDRLIVDPGAVFVGRVDGAGGSDVLELAAGTGNKTLSGLGTNFVNFEKVVFDANAGWRVSLDDFTGTISGFNAGDILDLTGKEATGATYANGVLTVQNGGTVVATLNLAGSYTSADFSVGADGDGGTEIGIVAAGPPDTPTAINGSVTTTENHTVSGSVTSTGDTDNNVAYIVDVGPAHGTLTSFNGATGAFAYTPAANYFGPDSFQFHAVDGSFSSNQATESITVDGLPPTGISFVADGALATLQVEGGSSGLHSSTAIGVFTETGGISGDAYTFTLGGASGFTISSASDAGTLSTGGGLVSGLTNGRVYPLTVTANDTTNSMHSAALLFDVVVGSGQNGSNANDTIKLDTGSGNLGISATTPTIVYGLNGKDTIDATGMTANVCFVGGPGADRMTGGGGVDTYIYASNTESRSGSGNFDIINGFAHGTDKIDFSALSLTNSGVANTNPSSFTSGNTTGLFSSQGAGKGIVVQHAGGAEQVYVDVNHDGNFNTNNDMIIHLNGITAILTNTDFIV